MVKKKKRKKYKAKRIILKRNYFQEFYNQIEKIAPLVLEILKKNKPARDYDNILYLLVWKAKGWKESHSGKQFKYAFVRGDYGTPETISRARRKIQEDERFKHLRGKFYKQRQFIANKFKNKIKNQLSIW